MSINVLLWILVCFFGVFAVAYAITENFFFVISTSIIGISLIFIGFYTDMGFKEMDYNGLYARLEIVSNSDITEDDLKAEISKSINENLKGAYTDLEINLIEEEFEQGVIKNINLSFNKKSILQTLYKKESKSFKIVINNSLDKNIKIMESTN